MVEYLILNYCSKIAKTMSKIEFDDDFFVQFGEICIVFDNEIKHFEINCVKSIYIKIKANGSKYIIEMISCNDVGLLKCFGDFEIRMDNWQLMISLFEKIHKLRMEENNEK